MLVTEKALSKTRCRDLYTHNSNGLALGDYADRVDDRRKKSAI